MLCALLNFDLNFDKSINKLHIRIHIAYWFIFIFTAILYPLATYINAISYFITLEICCDSYEKNSCF